MRSMSKINMGVHIPANNSEGEWCSTIWHWLSVPFESWVDTTSVCFLFVSADFLLPLRTSDILGSDLLYTPGVLVPVEMYYDCFKWNKNRETIIKLKACP